jgi:hypothetical protein
MNGNLPLYQSGEEIHAGDRVRYKGTAATIAFVTDGEDGEYASGYTDYRGYEAGIMLRDDDGALTFLHEPEEELEFVEHESQG